MLLRLRLILLLVVLALAACGRLSPAPTSEAVAIISPTLEPSAIPKTAGPMMRPPPKLSPTQPLPAPSLTATATIPPTPTATQTSTPTVTQFPTAVPIERQILIEYTTTSGDGTPPQNFYLGVAMPSFILYMDGRLLVQVEESLGGSKSRHYLEAKLTPPEMCALLDAVENTGFFDVIGGTGEYSYASEDPIYDFGDFQSFSEGAPYDLLIVNGPAPKYVQVYSPYWDYVATEVKAMRNLLREFSTKAIELYRPKQLVLWVEEGVPEWLDPSLASQPWLDGLPELSQLAGQQAQAGGYDGSLVDHGFEPLLEVLEYGMKDSLFTEANKEYWVIARQLLPHETPDEFPKFSWSAQTLPLPFECVP